MSDENEKLEALAAFLGRQVDDGTARKTGYFRGKKPEHKVIKTGFRRAEESEGAVVNAMIEGPPARTVRSREELQTILLDFV